MTIRNSLRGSALLLLVASSFACASQPAPDAYLCDACTPDQYVDGAQSLGPGRHVLFDFRSNGPRAFAVEGSAGKDVVKNVAVTVDEQRQFDIAKRVWSGPSPAHVSEGELEPWLRYRSEPRTVAAVLVTSAYRNDLSGALAALLPALLPRAVPAAVRAVCAPCEGNAWKQAPEHREFTVALAAGGSVDFDLDANEILRAVAVHDASGNAWHLDGSGNFVQN